MSSHRARHVVFPWGAAILAVTAVLAAMVAVIDPTADALWAWILTAVVLLAAREAYARYLREGARKLDPVDHVLEDR